MDITRFLIHSIIHIRHSATKQSEIDIIQSNCIVMDWYQKYDYNRTEMDCSRKLQSSLC